MLKKNEAPVARLKLLDVVELRYEVTEPGSPPWGGSVAAGALGTIVEELRNDVYLVEFDAEGTDPAILTLPGQALTLNWSAPAD